MDRQSEILTGIFNSLGITVPIVSSLVLINDQDTVKINDESVREKYLKRWEIKSFLQKIGSRSNRALINPKDLAKNILAMTIEDFEKDE